MIPNQFYQFFFPLLNEQELHTEKETEKMKGVFEHALARHLKFLGILSKQQSWNKFLSQ